ncbi:MAG: hypothetical protein QXX95_07325 [Nitrososphaerales archaeon]
MSTLTGEDDFLYWIGASANPQILDLIKRIEGVLNEFVGLLQSKGIPYVESHVFPFDTRSASITFGGYGRERERYFSISLEDLNISESSVQVGSVRVVTWVGSPEHRVFRDEPFGRMEGSYGDIVYQQLSVGPEELLSLLRSIYNENIRESYNYLPQI